MSDFRALYKEYSAFVWRSLRRLGVREADIEDAAQEVFVVVHRKMPEFAGKSSVKTWVFGICLKVASDWRKKAHIRRETDDSEVPERANSGELAVREIAHAQAREKLQKILNSLDEDKRAVFVLFELEQMPMADVARTLDCPVQTAYARLYAARKHVESQLASETSRKEVVS